MATSGVPKGTQPRARYIQPKNGKQPPTQRSSLVVYRLRYDGSLCVAVFQAPPSFAVNWLRRHQSAIAERKAAADRKLRPNDEYVPIDIIVRTHQQPKIAQVSVLADSGPVAAGTSEIDLGQGPRVDGPVSFRTALLCRRGSRGIGSGISCGACGTGNISRATGGSSGSGERGTKG